jgi:phi13 family phage major tail protein
MPKIGLDQFHYAQLQTDTPGSGSTPGTVTYGTVKRVPNIVQGAFTANAQSASYYADNAAVVTAAQLGDMALAVQSADIPPEVRAEWYGQEYQHGMLKEGQINPLDMAFGYRVKKAAPPGVNAAYRYIWLLKTKPSLSDETVNTQTNSISFQDSSTNFAIAVRQADGLFRYMVDSDDPKLEEASVTPEDLEENFFSSVEWCATNIFDTFA